MGLANMPNGDNTVSAQDCYALTALPHTPAFTIRAIRAKTAQAITINTPIGTAARVLDFAAGETRMVCAIAIVSTTGTLTDIEVML